MLRALAGLLLLILTLPAGAQVLPQDQSLVTFNRYVAVRERSLPGYAAPGIPVSGFTVQPSVDVNGLYNDNVLALDSGRRDDAILRLSPAVTANSNWSSSLLSLSATLDVDRFASVKTENTTNLNTSAYGWTDLSRNTRLRALGRFQTLRESRESQDVFVLTRRPVRFSNAMIGLGLSQRFARALVQVEGHLVRSDFEDAVRRSDGAPIDQDFRDSLLKRGRVRAEFGQSPALAYFVQGTYDQRDYRKRDTDPLASARGSKIFEALGGVRFELPILARGELGVGYTRGNYRAARLNTVSGLAVRGDITLFPTKLTNVTLTAERRVVDTGVPSSGGYSSLVGAVRVDHELLRPLLLSASARYERDRFNGVDRADRRIEFGASASYRLNGNLSARLGVSRIDLNSNGADAFKSFAANRVLVGVGYRL